MKDLRILETFVLVEHEVFYMEGEQTLGLAAFLLFSHSVKLTLCNAVDYSTPGFLVLHHLLELAQTHVH